MEQLEGVKYTRARRKESLTEILWSVLTDHVVSKNHTIGWDSVRLPAKEPDWENREVKEVIFMRKVGMHTINCDGGHHHVPRVFSKLLSCET